MISSSGVISMFDFSHISSHLAQPERLAPQFVLTTIIKLKFGKKRKTQCEARCLDTFISEILNKKIKIGIVLKDLMHYIIESCKSNGFTMGIMKKENLIVVTSSNCQAFMTQFIMQRRGSEKGTAF
jgi:hypothetical protein